MSEIVEILLDNAHHDMQLLTKNDQEGDNFQTSRKVDFILYAPTEEEADIVSSFINDNRYADASYEKADDQYRILAVVDMPTTKNILCSVSGLMACVATIFTVEYDGWSTTIECT